MSDERTRARRSPVRYVRDLSRVEAVASLSPLERAHLEAVARKYAFRANDHYLGRIDWSDPADPIRRIVIPDAGEAQDWGRLDASDEKANTVQSGVQHKYVQTVLLLVLAAEPGGTLGPE